MTPKRVTEDAIEVPDSPRASGDAPYPADATPLLYSELAPWFHLLSPPDEYRDEAATYSQLLRAACDRPPATVLELGSGAGNNAQFMKRDFDLTLVDLSPDMLALSRTSNPECRHVVGDMRSVQLGEQYDAVFIHDAVMYLISEADVALALATAARHCRPGGAILVAPDVTAETFRPRTSSGGHDAPAPGVGVGAGLRFLEWPWDPDPGDSTYEVSFAIMMRHHDGTVRTVSDRHRFGLFASATWLRLLDEAGFSARQVDDGMAESDTSVGGTLFVGQKRA